MSAFRTSLKVCFAFLATASLIACGSNDDGDSNHSSRVISLNADTNPVTAANGSIVSVDFSFSSDEVFDDGQNVVVVVHIPQELTFREGTSEVDSNTGEDRDVGPQGFNCGALGTYFLFDLDSDDLALANNPSGDADGRLNFTVDTVSASPSVQIQAIARNNTVGFSCESGFTPDAVLNLTTQ